MDEGLRGWDLGGCKSLDWFFVGKMENSRLIEVGELNNCEIKLNRKRKVMTKKTKMLKKC